MKKIITMGVLVFVTTATATAQELKSSDVPAKVKEAFEKKYAGVKAEWEKEGSDYEAEFKQNKTETSVVFDSEGNVKALEQEIKTTELPKGVSEYCMKNYPAYKLSEASKITEASGKVLFEAEMSKGKEHFDALFDEKANFVSKTNAADKED